MDCSPAFVGTLNSLLTVFYINGYFYNAQQNDIGGLCTSYVRWVSGINDSSEPQTHTSAAAAAAATARYWSYVDADGTYVAYVIDLYTTYTQSPYVTTDHRGD